MYIPLKKLQLVMVFINKRRYQMSENNFEFFDDLDKRKKHDQTKRIAK